MLKKKTENGACDMALGNLCSLQGSLFAMIFAGLILWKLGIIEESGKKCLTDVCVNLVIPCNILKSYFISFDWEILKAGGFVLLVASLMQVVALVANRFLFRHYGEQQRKVLQYGTIVSNGGFLGNPIAEGVYGNLGLLYASMFLIPVRIIMWSAGTSYFVAGSCDRKKVIRNILTHPCLVSVYLGLLLMITQLPLPSFLRSAIVNIGNCNAALTMLIIGTILADVDWRTIVNRTTLLFSAWRLLLLPSIAFGLCLLLGMTGEASGVCVMLTGMPAGATTAIFAARYHSDAPFATKCVVLSTLLSLFTIPLWCMLVGQL